jgi:hypothetical protein
MHCIPVAAILPILLSFRAEGEKCNKWAPLSGEGGGGVRAMGANFFRGPTSKFYFSSYFIITYYTFLNSYNSAHIACRNHIV